MAICSFGSGLPVIQGVIALILSKKVYFVHLELRWKSRIIFFPFSFIFFSLQSNRKHKIFLFSSKLNWVCSVIKLEEISSKDYWSNQNSDLPSTQQSCWKSRNLSMTKKSSQFSENDKNQMRYFGDFQTLWKLMTFFVLFRIWRMKNSSIWNFKKETNPDFRLKFQ